jgi:hypothetical protein
MFLAAALNMFWSNDKGKKIRESDSILILYGGREISPEQC